MFWISKAPDFIFLYNSKKGPVELSHVRVLSTSVFILVEFFLFSTSAQWGSHRPSPGRGCPGDSWPGRVLGGPHCSVLQAVFAVQLLTRNGYSPVSHSKQKINPCTLYMCFRGVCMCVCACVCVRFLARFVAYSCTATAGFEISEKIFFFSFK